MKLQQLRCVYEIVNSNFNVTSAAEKLYTSQPGVSKQIQLLEDEIKVKIFVRNGKRLVGLTEPGQFVYEAISEILKKEKNIRHISDNYSKSGEGVFTIATTHTQARYKLPEAVEWFIKKYPNIKLNIHQGNPMQVTEQVVSGEADIGIATESIGHNEKIYTLPCYQWNRILVAPHDHQLMNLKKPISLDDLSVHPLITYDYAFTGSTSVSKVFKQAQIMPNIVLTAIDADVIKTYVNLNLGIGLIAEMAYDKHKDQDLSAISLSHLFPSSTTLLGIRQDLFIREFVFDFIWRFTGISPDHLREKLKDRS
jgi:LysR family transcriptional regulator, cys regulon transcriptional activator